MIKAILGWLKENWRVIRISHLFYCLLVIVILYFVSGEIKYRYQKNHLEKLSPKQIVNLCLKAQWKEDHELLRKITHSTNEYTGERKKTQLEKDGEVVQRALTILFAIKIEAAHQRAVKPNYVEVGTVDYSRYWPFSKTHHSGMELLAKEDGIWKLHSSKWKYGEMIDHLKQNPNDLSSYYLCSQDMANDQNFLMEYRFKKKYYELDPKGFWITKDFLEKLKIDEDKYEINYENYEKQLLAEMATYSKHWKSAKARNYITLARIFMFHHDYQKAEHYLNDAENVLKDQKSERKYMSDKFDDAWNELKLRKKGKYVDPIEELDKLRLAM